jgi:molecular chaperone GrpE
MIDEVEITPADPQDEPPAAAATSPEPPVTPEAYAKLLEEKKDLYDRLLRKQAELENSRKRAQREVEEFRQHAAEDLIRSLLPTLDGFERALQHRDPSVPEAYYQGLELIYRQMREVLGRAGLVAIETTGKLFDPHLHQAVETVEAPGRREHEIVGELQRGYKLRHRLLRPAIVKVAVGTPPGSEDAK